ncbi:tyrosine-type recombinase/integrase [Amycolatopsis sp. CA-230715]|uniref:tyrosine-type recombinase/integrase n=1 Tax=Amycolatopsis sp. CA-230715 TaxID=2745196 RepID=UPI001C00CEA7|nr:tyrosine-type recombinase/integrase [Amycolatopsis sp. CA-230715]QWF79765.1 Tyrosine recombinase XerC [Amycolatopsis sp. CA-230715]
MMNGKTSYKVRVNELQARYKTNKAGERVPYRYIVRWRVGGKRHEEGFALKGQADSFRSDLNSAAKRGEAFDRQTGLPPSLAPKQDSPTAMTWYQLARAYAEMKWDNSAAKHRSSIADSLIVIVMATFTEGGRRPDARHISVALRRAFNLNQRDQLFPEHLADALKWAEDHSRPAGEVADLDVLRTLLTRIGKKRDGKKAARDTIRLRRITLRGLLDFGVEKKVLDHNPLDKVKAKRSKAVSGQVDRRSVVNAIQARCLLNAVARISPRLVVFFALLYFAGLRPEEAVNLKRANIDIPAPVRNEETGELEYGWGEIHLDTASPDIGAEWTDNGEGREERGLKHREDDDGRTVPCNAELSRYIWEHLDEFGTAADGRLVRAVRSDARLSSSVYGRVWARARAYAFDLDVVHPLLAKRPYDLRAAAVSAMLNATGDPVRVAEWAGHSVAVLLRVYAKCIDGGETQARQQLAAYFGTAPKTGGQRQNGGNTGEAGVAA